MAVQYRPGFGSFGLDTSGQAYRPGASQIFATPMAGSTTTTETASMSGPGASGIAPIAPPNIQPFELSTDAKSYPTWLRNLGENAAQQSYQRAINSIGSGNSAQRYMHAQDALNNARMGFMAQAGQQELTVQNALQDAWSRYNALLAQLYGTQVQQRGQDVSYASSVVRSPGGGVMSLGGGNSQLAGKALSSSGEYKGMGGNLANHYLANNRVLGNSTQPAPRAPAIAPAARTSYSAPVPQGGNTAFHRSMNWVGYS